MKRWMWFSLFLWAVLIALTVSGLIWVDRIMRCTDTVPPAAEMEV